VVKDEGPVSEMSLNRMFEQSRRRNSMGRLRSASPALGNTRALPAR